MERCDANLEEYIAGKQIKGLINWPAANKELQIECAVMHIMPDILNGLAFIHSCNEVHRDLSPQNSKKYVPFFANLT